MDQDNRIVVLIDMDCFYCQVEEKLNPDLAGKPIAVVQYNPWKGGGIIAVNYVARAQGVTRHMRGDEAKEKCPDIQLPSVPCQRGKADITKYRDAGKDVAKVLQKFTPLLERASIDEAYLDITAPVEQRLGSLNVNTIDNNMIPNTFALGYDSIQEFLEDIHTCGSDSIEFDYEHAKRLLVGAVIVSEIRAAVYEETGYRCSAGIAHNKILAKLVCGMNKPNKQTVLPKHTVNILYKTLPLKKVKHLGGKFGDSVREVLKINTMAELQQFTEKELQMKFDEKNGMWLYNIARGVDAEPVQARFNPKSIGCCKQLRGKSALTDLDSLRKWLRDLGDEIEDRLEKDALENNRTPRQMVVSFSIQMPNGQDTSSSRSYNFMADDELCGELFSSKALELLMESAEGVKIKGGEENRKLKAPIKFLGISVGKFEDTMDSKKTKKIKDYFNVASSNSESSKTKDNTKENSDKKISRADKKNDGKDYVLRKFFQPSNVFQSNNIKENDITEEPSSNKETHIEAALDKQESFFAKLLNMGLNKDPLNVKSENSCTEVKKDVENRTTTPVCNIVEGRDESNDSEYSGSTINMEINKSIALFEEDSEDVVARVSNMRQLLNSSKMVDLEHKRESSDENVETDNAEENLRLQLVSTPTNNPQTIETVECADCKRTISFDMLDVHADYHIALNLRNEERQQFRKELQDKTRNAKVRTNQMNAAVNKEATKKPQVPEDLPNERMPSIQSFFVKIDNTAVTKVCSECGKKVPVAKFTEHLDFHEAQKLSRQLNNKVSPVFTTGSTSKRKRKSVSPVKKPKVPCKSIDLFFK